MFAKKCNKVCSLKTKKDYYKARTQKNERWVSNSEKNNLRLLFIKKEIYDFAFLFSNESELFLCLQSH